MLVGKRPRTRPPMRRTTSMTGITVDVANPEEVGGSDEPHGQGSNAMTSSAMDQEAAMISMNESAWGSRGRGYDQRFLAMLSPRNHRRNNSDFLETSHFLRICGFCKRRLAPGRDIYMYKGDAAFCSVECREQQMEREEGRNKNGVVSSAN